MPDNHIDQKKSNTALLVFSLIMLGLLILANLINAPFTVQLITEQIEFGDGTLIELATLIVWMTHFASTPVILVGLANVVLTIIRKCKVWLTVVNAVLCLLAIAQIVITNLCIFY